MTGKTRLILSIISILVVGFGLGWLTRDKLTAKLANEENLRLGLNKFINPLLLANTNSTKQQFPAFLPLEDRLKKYIEQVKDTDTIKDVSVYVRDLNKTQWTGVNEDYLYSPASLLKVPLMIVYLKMAQANSAILLNKLEYRSSKDDNKLQLVKPREHMVPGQSYSVQDLIYKMIVYSDNNAMFLLFNNIDPDLLKQLFTDLKLKPPEDFTNETDFMSPSQYSYFFRILYNASYLNTAYSEMALELLSKTDFALGIVAPIPPDIPVVQKFGEREFADLRDNIAYSELHDCGIIYFPQHPYLLCVMTKGTNFDNLANVIRTISSITYQEIEKIY